MDRYFAGESFTLEETYAALRSGVAAGDIVPVLCGSAYNKLGISSLMNAINAYFPAPDSSDDFFIAKKEDGSDARRKVDVNDPLAALVFKTVADPYVGKLSYFKVYSGIMTPDTAVHNANTGATERIGKIFAMVGKKQIEVEKLNAGDIGAVTKLANTNTCDTLTMGAEDIQYKKIKFPKPYMTQAIMPAAKGDEDKISTGITKILEEDPTLVYENNAETKQMTISGMGDMQLDIVVSKLKSRFGTSVVLDTPKIAYRETIKGTSDVEGKHKKQSGGSGQYGHVKIKFSPGEDEGLTFTESVFGGAVPRNFFPAVEAGLRDCMQKGVLAGYPMVHLAANLYDGSYHDVDSNELSLAMMNVMLRNWPTEVYSRAVVP